MHRSKFGKASWMFFGAAVIWCLWILMLTFTGRPQDYSQMLDVCGIFPISGALAGAGIICGVIGFFRSRLGQSNCTVATTANVMFLIVLLLYKCV